VKPVQVDGGENVRDSNGDYVEFCEQFDFAAREWSVYVKFLRNRHEILLKNLERHNATPRASVFRKEV
jgi:hypothetical protein